MVFTSIPLPRPNAILSRLRPRVRRDATQIETMEGPRGVANVIAVVGSLTPSAKLARKCTRARSRQRNHFSFAATGQVDGVGHCDQKIVFHKVLRFCKAGHRRPPRLTRINGDLRHGGYRAVEGDALIHGPYLAAGPVGSDWRTQRPVVTFHSSSTGATK